MRYSEVLRKARDAELRIMEQSSDESYWFFFKKGKGWCMDATTENETLGRLLNHSRHRNARRLEWLLIGGPTFHTSYHSLQHLLMPGRKFCGPTATPAVILLPPGCIRELLNGKVFITSKEKFVSTFLYRLQSIPVGEQDLGAESWPYHHGDDRWERKRLRFRPVIQRPRQIGWQSYYYRNRWLIIFSFFSSISDIF